MLKISLRAAERTRRTHGVGLGLEGLESRTLMSATGWHAAAENVVVGSAVVAEAKTPVVPGPISLTNSIASSNLPASLSFTKAAKSFSVKISVANTGTGTTLKTAKVGASLVLRPTAGGADVPIGSKSGQAFGNVVSGKSKIIAVTVKPPVTLAAGSYTLVATVSASGFAPDSSNVVTGAGITISTGSTGSGSFLGKLGNAIRLTDLIESTVNTLPGGFGTTTTTHWHFVDEKNQTGELFLIQNTGTLAKAADATINLFPDTALGSGTVVLKGKDASTLASGGTTFTFGTSGTISCTTDTFTGKPCKVSRTN